MKTVERIILFLSIILFIGLVYISFFNVYQTDDYIFSYSTKKLGLFQNIIDFYLNWGGRYFGYSFNMLNPVESDKAGILPKVYSLFLLASFIGVVALNFSHFFKYSLLKSLQKSFLFFFFYTLVLVSLPEHYFWITGANIYFLPVIIGGLLLYLLGKFQESGNKGLFYFICFIVFLLMGSNEIMALILLGLLILFYLSNKTKESKVLMLIATVFLLVSFLAPGNFKRLSSNDDVFYIKWFKRIGVFGANTVYILIKTSLVIPLFVKVFEKDLRIITTKIELKTAILIWLVSFLPLIFLGYIFNMIGRQFENIIVFYLITSSVLWFCLFERIKKYWWISVVIILLPSTNLFPEKYANFNLDYNLNSFIKEIYQTDLKAYNREVNARIETIQKSDKDSVVVTKIKNIPTILYFDEMASVKEDENYVNDELQKYFHKKYIRTKD